MNNFGCKLVDYIRVFDIVVSPDTCERVISEYNKYSSHVKCYDTEKYKFHQLNLNETPLAEFSSIFARQLIPYYTQYFTDLNLLDYVPIESFEDVRIKKYSKDSEEFRVHVDIGDATSAKRFAIAILYLNSNNGYTEFPTLDLKIEPKPGRLIIFPPTWMFPHLGTMPTDSDKYIMMSCLTYT